jgi:signal peptidase I
MEPGLVTGDYILVSKFAYGWSRASFPFNPPLPGGRLGGAAPRRGDVVVFRRPVDPKAAWVKRVIGLPGDRVQVTAGRVTVNGQPLAQTAVSRGFDHDAPWRRVVLVRETDPDGRSHVIYGGDPTGSAENTAVYVVPPDRCFVMGDNRDNSADSRYPRDAGVGLLPTENIIGKAQIILFSWTPPVQGSRRGIGAGLALDRFFRPII